jgi:hypothetical protein
MSGQDVPGNPYFAELDIRARPTGRAGSVQAQAGRAMAFGFAAAPMRP